jgi:hypothetical protein
MVHAYLMYGFPTQTAQETIDSLEVVRQLFQAGVVQSGFWHQFAMTAHSPIGLNPDHFNVKIENTKRGTFANNDLIHSDPSGANHELFSEGLKKSLFNFMHDIGFDLPLQDWFDFKVPRTTVLPNFIQQTIENIEYEHAKSHAKILWLGAVPTIRYYTKKKKNQTYKMAEISFASNKKDVVIQLPQEEGRWLFSQIPQISLSQLALTSFVDLEKSFEKQTGEDFVLFWNSGAIKQLREKWLLTL